MGKEKSGVPGGQIRPLDSERGRYLTPAGRITSTLLLTADQHWLKSELSEIVCYEDTVVCNEDNVVYNEV